IDDVFVDATSVGPITNYTFTNVTTNHTIAVGFVTDLTPPFEFTQLDFTDADGPEFNLSDISLFAAHILTNSNTYFVNVAVRQPMGAQSSWAVRNMYVPPNTTAPPLENLAERFPLGPIGITPGTSLNSLEYDI